MRYDRDILKCDICGNIIGKIEDSGVAMECCGQEMTLLTANTTDAAQEKHVPSPKWDGGKLVVNVGSVDHPMIPEHYIGWIMIAGANLTQRIALEHTGAPTATFLVENQPLTVYAYCNLHGLWAAEI